MSVAVYAGAACVTYIDAIIVCAHMLTSIDTRDTEAACPTFMRSLAYCSLWAVSLWYGTICRSRGDQGKIEEGTP